MLLFGEPNASEREHDITMLEFMCLTLFYIAFALC